MKSFRRRARLRRRVLDRMLGEGPADAVIQDAESHYLGFVPEMVAVPRGILNGALLGTYELLAYGLALRARGVSAGDVGDFYMESYRLLSGRYPRFLLALVFRVFRPFLVRRLRKEARESRAASGTSVENRNNGEAERDATYPDRWEFDFLEPEPGGRGFGFDVRSCSVCSLFSRHGQSELVPYVCALDDAMSEAMGLGLRRSGTRAMGASCCDFRYEPGRKGKALREIPTFPIVD